MPSEMTHFLRDILRQPKELRWTLEYLTGAGSGAIGKAAAATRSARAVYLSGIGSSWHAAVNVAPMFQEATRPVQLVEASELLLFGELPAESAMIVISRSGRSIEIVQLVEKAKRSGVKVIGITNAPDGTLAKEADFAIVVPVGMDHAISVNTYSTLAAAAGVLAQMAVNKFDAKDASELAVAVEEAGRAIDRAYLQMDLIPERRGHLFKLVLAQQSVVDENTGQSVAHRAAHQSRGHCRVHAARKRAED